MAFTKLFDAAFYGGAQRNRLVKLDTPLGQDWLLPLSVFEQASDGKSHTLVLMDDLYFTPQIESKEIPFIRTGVQEETDGFTQWKSGSRFKARR